MGLRWPLIANGFWAGFCKHCKKEMILRTFQPTFRLLVNWLQLQEIYCSQESRWDMYPRYARRLNRKQTSLKTHCFLQQLVHRITSKWKLSITSPWLSNFPPFAFPRISWGLFTVAAKFKSLLVTSKSCQGYHKKYKDLYVSQTQQNPSSPTANHLCSYALSLSLVDSEGLTMTSHLIKFKMKFYLRPINGHESSRSLPFSKGPAYQSLLGHIGPAVTLRCLKCWYAD